LFRAGFSRSTISRFFSPAAQATGWAEYVKNLPLASAPVELIALLA